MSDKHAATQETEYLTIENSRSVVRVFTVDDSGYVLIDGNRILNNAHGHMLKHREFCHFSCQRCKQRNIRVELEIVKEFEHAIPAWRYYHSAANDSHRYCDECTAFYATPSSDCQRRL